MLIPGPHLFVFPLSERGDSEDFMDFFEQTALLTLLSLAPPNFILQQDNAPVHASQYSQLKFAELNIDLLPWPARSPDLNIIENVWSMISKRVYDGPQFANAKDLFVAIEKAVQDINDNSTESLQNLFKSIPHRLLEVVKLDGALTRY